MLIIILIFFLFTGSIVVYNPHSESLKNATRMPFIERLNVNKGTLILGTILIIIYLLTMNEDSYSTSDKMIHLFGLNSEIIEHFFVFQLITSIFLHFDLVHLCSNVLCLALLSSYERRVGIRKFFIIFLISAFVASLVDLIFLSEGTVSMGASAGICGLVSGYFIDYPRTSWKEWGLGLIFVLAIIWVDSHLPESESKELNYKIDWLAHLVGAISGGILLLILHERKKNNVHIT